ncbi:hypothetical protein IGL98_001898 [Enterococcus sp. DIV0840]|uniref:hypothetical protein n=1 Tax=Enterococcus sp. DIV0840 TaxID=2775001 RepID=UPI001A8C97FC|nr:hypothetical protein [Enterococcus sp. DIV0849a]MBO0433746.1 hypothetical protein [Enterococcus sp. DIV0849a]
MENKGGNGMNENTERLLGLIQQFQTEDLSLDDAIELRRLSAEFANECGEAVEQKMDQFYKK